MHCVFFTFTKQTIEPATNPVQPVGFKCQVEAFPPGARKRIPGCSRAGDFEKQFHVFPNHHYDRKGKGADTGDSTE